MPNCNGSTEGRIHSVETLGALDGPRLRYIVFLQGCRLRCQYCHNPDSWDCSGGTVITAKEQADDILRYIKYLSGGVTVSGGEPLLQPDFVCALFRECHSRAGLNCAVDTSGAVLLNTCLNAVREADLILLDIKAFDDSTALELTGSNTKNAWELLDYCEKEKKPVWIRHVLVPGKTIFETNGCNSDDSGNDCEGDFVRANPQLVKGASGLAKYKCIKRVDLLPFHKMGEYKWKNLGMVNKLTDTEEPSEEAVKWARKIFTLAGL